MANKFFSLDPELEPLWRWIDGGKTTLIVGGRLLKELEQTKARRRIRTWEQLGRAVIIPHNEIASEIRKLDEETVVSNDVHVIALARASGARLLCANDRDLERDFKNRDLINPGGAIYKSPNHNHLLRERPCQLRGPSSKL